MWKHMETASNLCSILVIIVSFQVFMQQFRVMSLLGDQSVISGFGPFAARPEDFIIFHFWV